MKRGQDQVRLFIFEMPLIHDDSGVQQNGTWRIAVHVGGLPYDPGHSLAFPSREEAVEYAKRCSGVFTVIESPGIEVRGEIDSGRPAR